MSSSQDEWTFFSTNGVAASLAEMILSDVLGNFEYGLVGVLYSGEAQNPARTSIKRHYLPRGRQRDEVRRQSGVRLPALEHNSTQPSCARRILGDSIPPEGKERKEHERRHRHNQPDDIVVRQRLERGPEGGVLVDRREAPVHVGEARPRAKAERGVPQRDGRGDGADEHEHDGHRDEAQVPRGREPALRAGEVLGEGEAPLDEVVEGERWGEVVSRRAGRARKGDGLQAKTKEMTERMSGGTQRRRMEGMET